MIAATSSKENTDGLRATGQQRIDLGQHRKDKDEHPDRTGSIMVAGTEYWINGWLKKTRTASRSCRSA